MQIHAPRRNQWERFVLGLGSIIETVIKLVCTSRQCKLQMPETSIMHSKMHLLFIIVYDFVTDILSTNQKVKSTKKSTWHSFHEFETCIPFYKQILGDEPSAGRLTEKVVSEYLKTMAWTGYLQMRQTARTHTQINKVELYQTPHYLLKKQSPI